MNGPNFNLLPWVTERFITATPSAAAKALDGLATHEAVLLLKPLKAEQLIACFNEMNVVKASAILRRLPSRQAAHILSRLSLPQAVGIYQAFSLPQREKMKTLLPAAWLAQLEQGHSFAEGSVGALMSRDFVTFRTETKVAEVIEKLKTMPRKKLPLACLITAGKEGKFKGIIRTAEMAFFSSNSLVGSVMAEVPTLSTDASAKEAEQLLEQGQCVVPVIDETGVPLGVLSLIEFSLVSHKKQRRFKWFGK